MDPRRAELCYRALVEKIPAVTFMAALGDSDAQELYVSPQIEALARLSSCAKNGSTNPFLWYYQLHPEDRETWAAEFARTAQEVAHFQIGLSPDRPRWTHGMGPRRNAG